jgi:glycosyltransferase involved in cell wall biosynthesis
MTKKICFVCHAYFPHFSGRKLRQTLALIDDGFEVDLICLRKKNDALRENFKKINIYRIPIRQKRGSILRYIFEYISSFICISILLSYLHIRKKYNIIHVQTLPDIMCFTALVPKLLGARIVLDNFDPMPELYSAKFHFNMDSNWIKILMYLEKISGSFADLVITQNKLYADILEIRGNYKRKIIPFINCPDERFFGNLTPPSINSRNGKTLLLFHGTITERHGVDIAIQAIKLISESLNNVNFLIAGNGDYLPSILNLINRLNMSKYVTYIGEKKFHTIPELITECSFGVIPHKSTVYNEINVPDRLFEYLWMGKAPIIARTKAILEYFPENTLIYFNPEDPKDMAEKIIWAINHPEVVHQKIVNAQKICLNYQWKKQKQAYTETINEII